MGRQLQIEWHETADELRQRYKREKHPQRRTRLQVLWHLCQGKRLDEVVASVGVSYRAVQNWVAWYRHGGLSSVLGRVTGHGTIGVLSKLTPLQQRALVAKAQLGDWRTVRDAVQWVADRWGIHYTYQGMYSLLDRLNCAPKVPRPRSEKADLRQQSAWKKGVS